MGVHTRKEHASIVGCPLSHMGKSHSVGGQDILDRTGHHTVMQFNRVLIVYNSHCSGVALQVGPCGA